MATKLGCRCTLIGAALLLGREVLRDVNNYSEEARVRATREPHVFLADEGPDLPVKSVSAFYMRAKRPSVRSLRDLRSQQK